jgi:DNA-binding transcriptional regulator YhcF (GntR family)
LTCFASTAGSRRGRIGDAREHPSRRTSRIARPYSQDAPRGWINRGRRYPATGAPQAAHPAGGIDSQPELNPLPSSTDEDLQPYQRIAADLRGAIDSGILMPGDPLPTEKTLAQRYDVAPSTAHRAIALLVAAGIVKASRCVRATVADASDGQMATITALQPLSS